MVRLLIGLGGNLDDTESAIRGALAALAGEGQVERVSRLWRTRAVGPSQPDYVNAAAVLEWPADPRALLARCQEIESAWGRDRSREERWGPRVLDLDLLLSGFIVCRGPSLVLPHPRFHERRFALEPAAEVAPSWVHPLVGLTVQELAEIARKKDANAVIGVTDFSHSIG
ncbi:MAG: 2-amino-4-hydroxy-6-hydroxymethyldihydropteridine diphosphokinase [Holophagae bacterium]|jgi:2-amino-4-hydroxy-6-hydroxymethyldihydropteridine diphosphokinase